jgi:uncharacterized protein
VSGSPVFLDTVGLLALWDRSDQWHAPASQAFQRFSKERARLYTSSLVLLECANAAARRPYRTVVAALWHQMKEAGSVFQPTEEDFEAAWLSYERGAIGGRGVIDLISFRVMRQLGIELAFTNDRHFQTAGFLILF